MAASPASTPAPTIDQSGGRPAELVHVGGQVGAVETPDPDVHDAAVELITVVARSAIVGPTLAAVASSPGPSVAATRGDLLGPPG